VNIALFLNRDIYCSVVLNHLVAGLAEHQTSVFYSDQVGRAPVGEALDVLRLIEQDIPNEHVFPSVDSGGELLTPELIERRHNISCETMNAPNEPVALDRLRALECDLVVAIRYGRIFKADFLNIPRLGVLNLHSGILPDYRGVMASFHALAAGACELGCTLHYIDDPTIDTGPIVAAWRRPADPAQSYFGHVLSLYEPGARLVVESIARLAQGEELTSTPQSRDGGAYFSFPDEDVVARFERRGYRLFHASEYRDLLRRYHGSRSGRSATSSGA
jgi:methionyl-tRNA formyltransferase